jgi:hypothetical protein
METLKEIAHISDFSIFKILARDLTLQICIKMKLDKQLIFMIFSE